MKEFVCNETITKKKQLARDTHGEKSSPSPILMHGDKVEIMLDQGVVAGHHGT